MKKFELFWPYLAMFVGLVLLVIALGVLPWWWRRSVKKEELAQQQLMNGYDAATAPKRDSNLQEEE